jgi:hypothetical protein
MPSPRPGLRLGFIEPHLLRFGGIRRMLEFANRLTARGHDVTFYLPDDQILNCSWMACDARIKTWSSGFQDDLDIILFNHEPHWHLLDRFVNARRRVFYALHYSRTYDKAGSWECLRTPVDLQLANSNWTADQIFAEIGSRPTVQLGGANREVFRPYGGPKKYPILCTGGGKRDWKGTDDIHTAAHLLGMEAEEYAPKDLSRPRPGVRRRRGLRGRELVRGLLPAGPRGHGLRCPAGYHQQRRLPRVRHRRRDRAGGAAP